VALPHVLWQLKDSDVASLSLLDTMLGVCAPAHGNALALLESGPQPMFFTYRRNNSPLFGPFVLLPRRAAAAQLTSLATRSKRCSAPCRASCRSVLP